MKKIVIYLQPYYRFWWNLARWWIWDLYNSSVVKINRIWKSKMVASRHLQKLKHR